MNEDVEARDQGRRLGATESRGRGGGGGRDGDGDGDNMIWDWLVVRAVFIEQAGDGQSSARHVLSTSATTADSRLNSVHLTNNLAAAG
jgi:hypothetical protein